MTDVEAWQLLDALEKAAAVWSLKRRDQEVLDQLHSVDLSGAASTLTFGLIGSPGGTGRRRAGDLARRTANAAALRRVLYARYPSVGLTSLESMKVRRNEDTALAVLESYARSLTRTAAQLRERARDVVYAHYAARGEPCPLDGPGPRTPDFLHRIMRTARLAAEWAYDVGRSARLETEAFVGVKASDVSNLACCGGSIGSGGEDVGPVTGYVPGGGVGGDGGGGGGSWEGGGGGGGKKRGSGSRVASEQMTNVVDSATSSSRW